MSRLERIVAACGGILLDGGRRALIPGPSHSERDRSVSLVETEEGRIVIHCFSPKDDWREVRAALADRGLLDDVTLRPPRGATWTSPRIATQPANEEKRVRAARLWSESRPIVGTPAQAYLRRRAIIAEGVCADALRFHPSMTSLDDRLRRPALIAAIRDDAGELQGVQVTLLTTYGSSKAYIPTPRRVIGALFGGAVRLHPASAEMAIGEGVETMMSAAAHLRVPAWAALTAENLSRFTPPPRVRRLIVAQDADDAGAHAFAAIQARLAEDIEIVAALPPDSATDWNAWARRGSQSK